MTKLICWFLPPRQTHSHKVDHFGATNRRSSQLDTWHENTLPL
jgi:hypothetical protein